MTGNRRLWGLGLIAAILVCSVPGSSTQGSRVAASATQAAPPAVLVPPRVEELVRDEPANSDQPVGIDISLEPGTDPEDLKRAVAEAGGEVLVEEETYLRVRIPPAAAHSVANTPGVSGVGVNESVSVDVTQTTPSGTAVAAAEAKQSVNINLNAIGVGEFRRDQNVDGRNVVVAVVDSGIDPGHPDFRVTTGGQPKVIDWKDFTREGYVTTSQAVRWGESFVTAEGREYLLPTGQGVPRAAQFGYLDEYYVDGYINQDLDRNGQKIDRFGVLVLDLDAAAGYDTVFVDTNNDRSFRDEKPLTLYRQGFQYASLGQYRAGSLAERRLNFVVADIDPEGRFVQLGFDSHGHGTWVGGIIGGYSPGGFSGAAPGVQLMALKVLKSTTGGDWFNIKDAILYAATHGASVINVSIGDLASGAAKSFDSGASEWLNQIAARYGVLIVLAAGNSGPGLSSGSTLGNASSVLAAGGYFSPDMWQRDYGWVVPHESVWFFSGMGPRSDGTYLPSVIAPAGSPAPSPQWRDPSGYYQAVGTSIATPHISGAAALLMEAGRKAGISYDWASVKLALEMGARRITGFEAYEQGQGLVQLTAAFNHLKQINANRPLKANTSDGSSGLLARSYTPGDTLFYITNTDPEPTRVGIVSPEPWVRPALTSLLLPPGTRRQLPVQIEPQLQ
ncbi:MAG TPA: S8 family serine peptidase, partial [Symbiobacteriaceae bacterium]|nr:S8 family serine peptidase [Symbiobacteriaceae bacterium]